MKNWGSNSTDTGFNLKKSLKLMGFDFEMEAQQLSCRFISNKISGFWF